MYMGFWDVALVIVVSLQATLLAYLYHPKWKAFVLTLPIPFTVATLALGQPIGVTNVLGAACLLAYTHAVRILHLRFRVPIIGAIVTSALGYCVAAYGLAQTVPQTNAAFWLAWTAEMALGVWLFFGTRDRREPGHRSPLPVYIKLPIVIGVVLFLVLAKNALQGFMTMFPMVSVVAAYEARHSLWTMGRQMPIFLLTMLPLQATARLTEPYIGLLPSLIAGWAVFLVILLPLTRYSWQRAAVQADALSPTSPAATP